MNLWTKVSTHTENDKVIDKYRRSSANNVYVLEKVVDVHGRWSELWVGEYRPATAKPETVTWVYADLTDINEQRRFNVLETLLMEQTPNLPSDLAKMLA